jgi:hypothetical protein
MPPALGGSTDEAAEREALRTLGKAGLTARADRAIHRSVTMSAIEENRPAEKLADDLLFGAQAIADELGIDVRRTYYLLEQKLIPGTKLGSKKRSAWTASRKRLRAHFETA